MAKATVQLSLEDSKGNKSTYLGLLDTGSTASLMSEELVTNFKLVTKNSKHTWDTNNGEFKTGKTAVTSNLRFPQFTNKRKIDGSKFYVKKIVKQKYKIIFGLNFLLENEFDFILSKGVISWQGIQVTIDGNEFSKNNKNECQNNGK